MTKIIPTLTASTALILFTACSPAADTPAQTAQSQAPAVSTQAAAMDGKVKAVLLYADWCGSCKVLDPKLKAVRAGNKLDAVGFVVLDYTSKDKDDFYAQAAAAGVDAPLRAMLGDSVKTGLLVLVDADDNKVIGQVTKAMSETDILTAIQAAVAGA